MGSINMQTCLEETYVLSTDSQSHVFICSIDDVFLWLIQLWDLWFINIVKNIHWVQILHSNSEYRTDSVKKTNHRCLMPMKVELTNFRTIYMEKSQNHRPFPGTRIGGSFARGCPFFYMEKSQYQSLLESEKKKNRITKTMVRMRNFNNIHPSAEILTMRRLKLELELQSY